MISTLLGPIWKVLPRHPALRLKRLGLADAGASMADLTTAIGKTELFCNAGEPLVHQMLGMMQARRVRRGELILRQGARSDRFTVLATGQAEVTRAREGTRASRSLAVLKEPAGLGEEALMGVEIRSITVVMLTNGVVLEIRRADFARFVSVHGVQWVTPAAVEAQPPPVWLWIGTVGSRPRDAGADVQAIPLERLRERLSDLAPQRHYLCGGRDEGSRALAAFLLAQRGFTASAVRDGKRAVAHVQRSAWRG